MLRVMLIGYGYWGPNLARALQMVSGLELVSVSDAFVGNLDKVKERYPHLSLFSNYRDGLGDVDAVFIATPPVTHFDIAAACLCEGKHVYIEKPITPGIPEAVRLHGMAVGMGLTLMVGHIYQYSPPVAAMARVVSEGLLGEILYYESERANLGRFSGSSNVIWDLLPHDLSILSRIGAGAVESVSCHTLGLMTPGIADVAHLTLRMEDGTRCFVTNSWYDPQRRRRFAVVGKEASLVLDEGGPARLTMYEKGAYAADGAFQYFDKGEKDIPFDSGEALVLECQHFADCILASSGPRTGAPEAIGVLRVMEAAQGSSEASGAWVTVDHPDISEPQP